MFFFKLNELIVYIVDHSPDKVLLTETWCNTTISDAALSLPGYQLELDLRKDRNDTTNGIGGGLLGLSVSICDKFSMCEFNQFCCFKIKTKGNPLTIILVYRPPGSGYENSEELCKIMRNFDNQTILIGDVNLPEINWSDRTSAARGREVLTTAQTENLEQLVDFPTHIKGNTLDLVLTNCSERFISISNGGRIGKSDHCILNMEVKIDFVKRNDKAKRPNWTKADFAGLRGFLGNIDWNRILTDRPVEEAWTTFRSTLDLALAKFVPNSTVRNENTPKWLTREIVKLVRRKKRPWRLTQTHGTTENFNKYKSLEKEVTVRLRNAKRSMEKRLG